MRREIIEQILAAQQIKAKDKSYVIPEKKLASLLIGQSQVTALPGIVRITLADEFLMVESKKGASTYLEYDVVRALSFESKEIADRQAGFV